MLLVQFDWTVYEVVLLMQTKISRTMAEALSITNWGVGKMMWKGEGEEKHSISWNCSTIQQKHRRCQPGRHVAIIALDTEQDKALVSKNILTSQWFDKNQSLDPIPSPPSSEWKVDGKGCQNIKYTPFPPPFPPMCMHSFLSTTKRLVEIFGSLK